LVELDLAATCWCRVSIR